MKYVELTGSNGDIIKLYVGKCTVNFINSYDTYNNTMCSLTVEEVPTPIADCIPYTAPSSNYTIPDPKEKYVQESGTEVDYVSAIIQHLKSGDTSSIDYNNETDKIFTTALPYAHIRMTSNVITGSSPYYLFNGYFSTFPYNNIAALTPLRTLRSNYTYILYDENVQRYKWWYNSGNGIWGSVNGSNKRLTSSDDLSKFEFYKGAIILVSTVEPLETKTYSAFRADNNGNLYSNVSLPSDINYSDYAYIQTKYYSYFDSSGYLCFRSGYTYGRYNNPDDMGIDVNALYCFERGILDNLKEDEPEPEPEKGEGPMHGPLETGMITMYASSTSTTDLNHFKDVAKGVFSKDYHDSLSNYWNGVSDGIINFQLYPVDLTDKTDIQGNKVLGDYSRVSIFGVPVPQSGAELKLLNNQFIQYDCGTKHINLTDNIFFNHSPYTTAQLILPYAGSYEINVDEFIGGYMHIIATIDLYNGNIIYEVYSQKEETTDEKTLQYRMSGNLSYGIPITGREWGQTHASAVQGITNLAKQAASMLGGK